MNITKKSALTLKIGKEAFYKQLICRYAMHMIMLQVLWLKIC